MHRLNVLTISLLLPVCPFRVRIEGWNVEAGYLLGDDTSSFSAVDEMRGAVASGDRGVWHGDLLW